MIGKFFVAFASHFLFCGMEHREKSGHTPNRFFFAKSASPSVGNFPSKNKNLTEKFLFVKKISSGLFFHNIQQLGGPFINISWKLVGCGGTLKNFPGRGR